ncbi:MAG: HNH endonuclease [Verrucomicrobiota bacterium]
MSRKQFIESHGATCRNWRSSWSFINKAEKFIIFGAWDKETRGESAMILSQDWGKNRSGGKNQKYIEAREHIRLVEEAGYRLMTFPMQHARAHGEDSGSTTAKIADFTPQLSQKKLTSSGHAWYAIDTSVGVSLPEELITPELYPEGAQSKVTINAYERNPKARAACIAHHGHICAVCGFDFARVFGALGAGYIHVHHIVPVGKLKREYNVDPIKDLIPICPNCHAMIHRPNEALSLEELRKRIKETKTSRDSSTSSE